jgi:hypothetical protein
MAMVVLPKNKIKILIIIITTTTATLYNIFTITSDKSILTQVVFDLVAIYAHASMVTHESNCILLLDYGLELPKYNITIRSLCSRKVGFLSSSWNSMFFLISFSLSLKCNLYTVQRYMFLWFGDVPKVVFLMERSFHFNPRIHVNLWKGVGIS